MKKKFLNEFFREAPMMEITLQLEPALALFYARIAFSSGRGLEQVIQDALFRLAAELSLEALQNNQEKSL